MHKLSGGKTTGMAVIFVALAAFATVFFPIAGHAATATSKTAGKSASTTTATAQTPAKEEATTAFSRAVAAGKAVAGRALSSREKSATPEVASAEVAKTEPTEFQKKMAAIAQGEASTAESSSADLKAKAASSGEKVKSAKVSKATKEKDEAEKPDAPKPVIKQISGTVTGINNQGIAIEYAQDKDNGGMEFWINFDKKVQKAGGLKEVSGIGLGDTVSGVYDEYPNKAKKLTGITLVKKKPKGKEEA